MDNNDFTKKELEVLFDVVNVYDPNDISHVYPEMGSEDFVSEVKGLFHKLQDALREADRREKHDPEKYYWHPEEVANRKWCEQNKVN